VINDTAWYNEMHNFSSLHTIYHVSKDSTKNGITNGQKNVNGTIYGYTSVEAKATTELVKDNISIKTNLEPLIKEAINTLGKEKMKALNFEKGQIQAELIKVNDLKSNEWKIASLLKYNVGQFITLADVKTKLQSIYDRLEINKKAVATDINQYFETKNQSKRTGSSVVQGMVIINKKFKNK
jgi:hypothetical protein